MDEVNFQLYYDAAQEGLRIGSILDPLILLGFGAYFLRIAIKKKNKPAIIFVMVWLLATLILGSVGGGNLEYQRLRCKRWAETNNFKIVEGMVEDFHPMPFLGHDTERFIVNGVKFEYSDFNSSKGGFNNASSRGGPFKENLYVRIGYKKGRILKIWIAK